MRDFPVSLIKHVCSPECEHFCWEHNRHEDYGPDSYLVCFECHHVFRTEEELIEGHNRQLEEAPHSIPVTSGDQVFCCPHCIHDF